MGDIQLSINIESVDLLVACGVLIIAVIALVGIFMWSNKTNKQIKTLEDINGKLVSNVQDGNVNVTVINNDKTLGKQVESKKVDISDIDKQQEDLGKLEEDEIEPLIDIADLVAKDLIAKELKRKERMNIHEAVGKSGKIYTEDEINTLINK